MTHTDLRPIAAGAGHTVLTITQPIRIAALGFVGLGPGVYRIPGDFRAQLGLAYHDRVLIDRGLLRVEYIPPASRAEVPSSEPRTPAKPLVQSSAEDRTQAEEVLLADTDPPIVVAVHHFQDPLQERVEETAVVPTPPAPAADIDPPPKRRGRPSRRAAGTESNPV